MQAHALGVFRSWPLLALISVSAIAIHGGLPSAANAQVYAGRLELNSGERWFDAAVIDTANGYAYFGASGPGKIVKVSLSDFTRVGALTLNADEQGYVNSAVIDAVNGYAYFGTGGESPGKIIKVRLSDFTRAGALDLYPIENSLRSAVIDLQRGYAYFGTDAAIGPGGFGKGVIVRIGIAPEGTTTATTTQASSAIITTTTVASRGIPSNPPESIAAGLILGIIAVLGLRRIGKKSCSV